MRHYHGTPIGGKRHRAVEFCEGRSILIPWKRPEDLPWAMEASRGFIVDNSAFSFWNSDIDPNWSEYAAWILGMANHPRFEFCFIPDVIDGTETDNDYLIDWWGRTMVGVPSCPVWHMHESILRLQRLAMKYERVAIGSSGEYPKPAVGKWWARMDEAFAALTDKNGYPIAKIHGLRMLRRDIIERYPLASADSTNATQNGSREAKKNNVDTGWGQMTLARRIEGYQSPSTFKLPNWDEPPKPNQLFQLGDK